MNKSRIWCYILSTLAAQHWPDGQSSLVSHLLVLLMHFFKVISMICQERYLNPKISLVDGCQWPIVSQGKWIHRLKLPSFPKNAAASCGLCCWLTKCLKYQAYFSTLDVFDWCNSLYARSSLLAVTNLTLASLIQPPSLVWPGDGSVIFQHHWCQAMSFLTTSGYSYSPPVFTRRSWWFYPLVY